MTRISATTYTQALGIGGCISAFRLDCACKDEEDDDDNDDDDDDGAGGQAAAVILYKLVFQLPLEKVLCSLHIYIMLVNEMMEAFFLCIDFEIFSSVYTFG